MKQGTTQAIKLALDVDMAAVDTIIFTIKAVGDFAADILLQKQYPTDTQEFQGAVYLTFTQEETELLPSLIFIEGQINFTDKSVAKTEIIRKFVGETLFTQLVAGNAAHHGHAEIIPLKLDGDVVIVRGIDGKDGAQGIQGEPGADYILTTQDRQEIADIVGGDFASADELAATSTNMQTQIDTITSELVGVSALQQVNLTIIRGVL